MRGAPRSVARKLSENQTTQNKARKNVARWEQRLAREEKCLGSRSRHGRRELLERERNKGEARREEARG